ncbi:MAG: hypothetical protein ACP5UN_02380 [Candidatus Micrarchaeia archaeon]
MNKSILGLGILIILIIVIGFIFYWNGSSISVPPAILTNSTSSNTTSTMALMITDPPFVPIGTESLIINYNGLSLHESGTSSYYNISTAGSVNVLSLSNITQTIALLNIPKNLSFDSITFEGLSATATIDNKTYNIELPSNNITVSLNSNASARISKALLVDLSPSIIQVYNNSNSTFVLHPQAIATVLSNNEINSSIMNVGARIRMNANIIKRINSMFPNISITGASLAESGNTISFSVSVSNKDNSSVEIKHIMLIGFMAGIKMNISGISNVINIKDMGAEMPVSITANITSNEIINTSGIIKGVQNSNGSGSNTSKIAKSISEGNLIVNERGAINFGREFSEMGFSNIRFNESINESIMRDMHGNVIAPNIEHMIEDANFFNRNFHDVLNFEVAQNGSLILPFDFHEAEGPNGFDMNASSTHTFTYNGNILLGDGRIAINIIPNQTYYIVVIGEDGAHAIANVTAS